HELIGNHASTVRGGRAMAAAKHESRSTCLATNGGLTALPFACGEGKPPQFCCPNADHRRVGRAHVWRRGKPMPCRRGGLRAKDGDQGYEPEQSSPSAPSSCLQRRWPSGWDRLLPLTLLRVAACVPRANLMRDKR